MENRMDLVSVSLSSLFFSSSLPPTLSLSLSEIAIEEKESIL